MKNGLVKPEDMTGFAERIYNEASRLITLVEDIIKLSKLDEGNVELEKEEVSLRAVPYCMWNNRGQGEMLVWHKLRI